MGINYRLARAMAEAGVSQAELGRITGIDRKAISGWVNGRHLPKVNKALCLAHALGCTVEDIFGDDRKDEGPWAR